MKIQLCVILFQEIFWLCLKSSPARAELGPSQLLTRTKVSRAPDAFNFADDTGWNMEPAKGSKMVTHRLCRMQKLLVFSS